LYHLVGLKISMQKVKFQRFGTLCLFHLHSHPPSDRLRLFFEPNLFPHKYPSSTPNQVTLWRWNRHSVPRFWHLNYRRRGITLKKETTEHGESLKSGTLKLFFFCVNYIMMYWGSVVETRNHEEHYETPCIKCIPVTQNTTACPPTKSHFSAKTSSCITYKHPPIIFRSPSDGKRCLIL
jgi:hypothetical protein